MAEKQTYRRLQVDNIWLRTFFEMAAIIAAIIVCGNLVVSNYENSYVETTRASAAENALQIGHYLTNAVDVNVLAISDDDRREYAKGYYGELLESCFINGDMLYSGAIYDISGDGCELFACTKQYSETIETSGLLQDGEISPELAGYISSAAAGAESTASAESTYFAFVPVNENGVPRAVVVSAAEFRSTLDYESNVKNRLVLISLVSGLLIVLYFCISAAHSERKKKKGEAVNK